MKKRYIAIPAVIAMIALSFAGSWAPVRPFIQLPGEVYPKILKGFFGGWTNTFSSFLVVFVLLVLLAVYIRSKVPTVNEVPTGFYNFFEWIVEGVYGFVEGLAGDKAKVFFPWFMTYMLLILTANWMGLVPGVDSIGFWEYKPHFKAEKDIKSIEADLAAVVGDEEEFEALLVNLEETYHVEANASEIRSAIESDGHLPHEFEEELLHEIEHVYDEQNLGDIHSAISPDQEISTSDASKYDKTSGLLLRAQGVDHDNDPDTPVVPPDNADWTIVPFFRPAATDLNMTLALALIAMVMVQFYGIKYLGGSYFYKFFPFLNPSFGSQVAHSPIKAIDPVVGLLELVSEISKIISFAFRLLGNIFAGMVLLFVMSFLLPAANIVFFGLEFFVGLIQALVFALLMVIFMVGATESHHGDDHH